MEQNAADAADDEIDITEDDEGITTPLLI